MNNDFVPSKILGGGRGEMNAKPSDLIAKQNSSTAFATGFIHILRAPFTHTHRHRKREREREIDRYDVDDDNDDSEDSGGGGGGDSSGDGGACPVMNKAVQPLITQFIPSLGRI